MFHFHHVGVACRSLQVERVGWESLGYSQEGDAFEDLLQGVAGMFLTGPGPRVELLENLDGSDTITPFLEVGTKMYHQAFEVQHLGDAMTLLQTHRAKVLSPRKPACAFNGREVAFMMMPTRLIIELIEME